MVIHLALISQLSALSQSQPWWEVAGAKKQEVLPSVQLATTVSRVSSSVSCFRSCSWGFLSYLEALPLPRFCLQIHHLQNIFFFKRRVDQLWRGLTTLSWQFPPQKTLLCAMNVHFAMFMHTFCISHTLHIGQLFKSTLCIWAIVLPGERGRVTLATL